jgi:hypothetical protein
MPNPLLSAQFTRLLDKRLRDVFNGEYKQIPRYKDKIFNVMKSDSAFEEFYGVTGLPDIPRFNGKLSYMAPSPGYYLKIEPAEFAAGVMVERKLLEDNKYPVLENFVGMLGTAMARTEAKDEVKIFQNAFSAAFDYMVTEEGVALCSSSHTTKTGASVSTGFSNVITTALSKANLTAAKIIASKFRDDQGERIDTNFDTIICGQTVADTAWELINTPYGYQTGARDKNVEGPEGRNPWKLLILPRLEDNGDTNNWFLGDSAMMKQSFMWIDRISQEFDSTKDFDTFQRKYATYRRYGWGFRDWRPILGANVA